MLQKLQILVSFSFVMFGSVQYLGFQQYSIHYLDLSLRLVIESVKEMCNREVHPPLKPSETPTLRGAPLTAPEIPPLEILSPEILTPEIPSLEILSPEIPSLEILTTEFSSPELPTLEIPKPRVVAKLTKCLENTERNFDNSRSVVEKHPVSRLHEIQAKNHGNQPIFKDVGQRGQQQNNNVEFQVQVTINDKIAAAWGHTKKDAKRRAAIEMLKLMDLPIASKSSDDC